MQSLLLLTLLVSSQASAFDEGYSLYKEGKLAEAVEAYRRAIIESPKSPGVYFELGITYKAQKKWKLAQVSFQTAVKFQPTFYQAYSELGAAYLVTRDYQKARAALIRSVKLKDKQPKAHCRLGYVLIQLDEPKQAEKYLLKAVRYDPGYGLAWGDLANAYLLGGKEAKAFPAALRAMECSPGDKATFSILIDAAAVSKKDGDIEYTAALEQLLDNNAADAEESAKELIASGFHVNRAKVLEGRALLAQEKFPAAAKVLQAVLKLDAKAPRSSRFAASMRNLVHEEIVRALLESAAYLPAEGAARAAIKADKKYGGHKYMLACALAGRNDKRNACKALGEAFKLDSSLRKRAKEDKYFDSLKGYLGFKVLMR